MFPSLKSSLPMLGDSPTKDKDLLQFGRYVKPLVDVIRDPLTDTPFTIGVFGRWGSGKTTLMQMVADKLEGFPIIWFNPWQYQSEDNLLVPLLHTIHDSLMESKVESFKQVAKMVAVVAAQISASVLMKHLTMEKVSFEEIEKRIQAYTDKRGATLSAIRTLRTQLQGVVDKMTEGGTIPDRDERNIRLVIFIDDLDRCVPPKIIALLEAVKLFLDLKHTVLFLAIDRDVVEQGIRVFYKDLGVLQQDQLSWITADYLDKMIQLPLFLYPLGADKIGAYLHDLSEAPDLVEQQALFKAALIPNPRKIKRILNIYRLNVCVSGWLGSGDDHKQKRALLAKLVIIQQQWEDLYRAILVHHKLPCALERVYGNSKETRLYINNMDDWTYLGEEMQAVHAVCKSYYQPSTPIEGLFTASPAFGDTDLKEYLYMLG